MTPKEAHCWLEEKQRMMTQYRYLFSSEDVEANGVAICALEKQIPKKPIRGKYGHAECAVCGSILESFCGDLEKYPFCSECGQSLDWTEDNE